MGRVSLWLIRVAEVCWSIPCLLLRESQEAAQRDAGPVGAVAELVARLIERFLDLEQAQQRLHLVERLIQSGGCRDAVVAGEESAASLALPLFQHRFPTAGVFRGRWSAQYGCPPGVGERAQHAGDVAQRGMLHASLHQAAPRLTLEVHDDEIIALQEYLAEVVVTVMADFQSLRRLARQ